MGPDALLNQPDVVPSLAGAAIRAALAIALLVAAAVGWIAWQRRARGTARRLEVLDRAFLTRGASVALLRVGERQLLIGVSADGVRLLRDFERGEDGRVFAESLASAGRSLESAR